MAYQTTYNTPGLSISSLLGARYVYLPWEGVILEVRKSRGSKMRSEEEGQ